MESAKN